VLAALLMVAFIAGPVPAVEAPIAGEGLLTLLTAK
jgi:hypothetical protein